MANDTMGRVLPFARSAAQVRSFASRRQEQGNPLTALDLLHLSLAKAPDDLETVHSLAEAYASLQCWALSNEAFFAALQEEERAPACFFGMGCNFYSMRMYATAHDCLALALQKAPLADFAPDAVEMIEAMEEAESKPNRRELALQRRMSRVMEAMDQGKVRLAARQIRRVLPLDRGGSNIHSLQAFTLLAAGDAKGALKAAREACRLEPRDVRALCAMASVLKTNRALSLARTTLRRAAACADDEEAQQLVCQTACEMGEHAFAADMLLAAEKQSPYDVECLHLLASSLHNCGQTEEAVRRWRLLRRIDPADTVAVYRLNHAANGELPDILPYARQVPLQEMLSRLERLRGWIHEGNDAFVRRWEADEQVAHLLRWGLTCGEPGIPQAMCGVLATVGGERAQALLRSVLCDAGASRALKQSALASLFSTGAEGPFFALMDDHLTLVHVSRAEDDETRADGEGTGTLYRAALRGLSALHREGREDLRRMCETAEKKAGTLSQQDKVRAVQLACCRRFGLTVPYAPPSDKHRKVERLARRILLGG